MFGFKNMSDDVMWLSFKVGMGWKIRILLSGL